MLNNLKNTLGNIAGSFFGSKAGEIGSQHKFTTDIASSVLSAISSLLDLHSPQVHTCNNEEELKKYIDRISFLVSLKEKLNEAEKANPSIKDFSIIKFCRSIIENDKLNKELNDFTEKCNNTSYTTDSEEFSSHLDKIVKNFNIHQLHKKMSFLNKLEGKSDFSSLSIEYKDGWDVYNLLIDKDFRQYVNKTIVSDFVNLAKQGEDTARKYFGDVKLQAYYTKTDDTHNILNINLIDGSSRSEPTQISDILQQEKDVQFMNIFCNKKHEVRAHKYEDNTRNYEFKKGAHYEMTSNWPVEDESGKISMCTMVMNVGNGGITKILAFNNGEKSEFQNWEEILELARKNSELRIQGLLLYDAIQKHRGLHTGEKLRAIAEVEESKEPGSIMPDVVPVADHALQNDKIVTIPDSNDKQDPEDGPGSAGSTAAAHIASDSEAIIPNQDPSSQGSDLTTVNDDFNKEREALKKEVSMLNTKNMEFEQETGVVLQVMKQQCTKMKAETQVLHVELEKSRAESNKLSQEFNIQKETNERLENELKEALELAQKDIEEGLLLNQQLERAEAEKRKLEQDVEQKNERVRELEYKIKNQDELSRELEISRQANERLENKLGELSGENSDLQDELKKKEQEVKAEKDKIHQKLTQLNIKLQERAQKLEEVDKEREGFKSKLKVADKSNEELEDKRRKLETELNREREEIDGIMNENGKVTQSLKSQMCTLEKEHEEQQKSSAERIGELRWKITELENSLKMKDKELKFYEQGLKESHKEAKDLDDRLKELDEMLSKGSEENEDLREIVAGKVQEIEKLQHELKLIEEDLECASNKLQRNENDGSSPELSENLKNLLKSSELIEGLSLIGDVILPLKKQLSRSASLESCDSGLDSDQDSRSHSPTAPNSPSHRFSQAQVTRASSVPNNSGSNWSEKFSGNKSFESKGGITCGGK